MFYFITSNYALNPLAIVRIWDGGMAFHGGFVGVVVAVILFCWANKLSLWPTADLIAVSTPPVCFLASGYHKCRAMGSSN